MPTKEEAEKHVNEHPIESNISVSKAQNSKGQSKQIAAASRSSSLLSPKIETNASMERNSTLGTKSTSAGKKANSPLSQKNSAVTKQTLPAKEQQNDKLMKCKRCQVIVEKRHVKSHVCSCKKFYCNLCDSIFAAEHVLAAHLDIHRERAAAIEAQKKCAEQDVKVSL